MCKMMPVARRILGESRELTLRMKWTYAQSLYKDASASLDDVREAVATLVETARTSRRVMCGTHPFTAGIEKNLREARALLRARETTPAGDK